MTRELKFRAWDRDNNKMIFWSLGDLLVRFGEPEYQYNVMDRPSVLFDWMEYVGLGDENGNEIYTGDIVKSCGYFYKIIFKDGCFGFENINPINRISMNFTNLSKELAQIIEVVGNVYEHEYLLDINYKDNISDVNNEEIDAKVEELKLAKERE